MKPSNFFLLAPFLFLAVQASPLGTSAANKAAGNLPPSRYAGVLGTRPVGSVIGEQGKPGCSIFGCFSSTLPKDRGSLDAVRNSPKDKDRIRGLEDQHIIAENNRQAKDKQEYLRKHGKNVKQHIPGGGKDGHQ